MKILKLEWIFICPHLFIYLTSEISGGAIHFFAIRIEETALSMLLLTRYNPILV